MKAKIKSYGDEVTNFYDKEIPKAVSSHTFLVVISLHSALYKDGNYCPHVFLKECKSIEKEKKVIRHITEDIQNFYSDSDEE